MNAILKLLRTVYDRPDLAVKVKILKFKTFRKSIGVIASDHGVDVDDLRRRGLTVLKKMGYSLRHPWWRSIENTIESAFAGLLLLELPNLSTLNFCVQDHVIGPSSSECVTGLFGLMSIPDQVRQAWRSLQHLITGDTHVLKCGIDFHNLVSLDLKQISIGTILRLNGHGCLQGTEKLQNLVLTVSIQFADRALVRKADAKLSDLFDALDCLYLQSLSITLINDGYQLDDDIVPQFDPGYMMEQISIIQHTLKTLRIQFDSNDYEMELDWLLDLFIEPSNSWEDFSQLKHLAIPQAFFFMIRDDEMTGYPVGVPQKALPPNLESLEVFFPYEEMEPWAYSLTMDGKTRLRFPSLQKITLTCRNDVGAPSSHFMTATDEVWLHLSRLGIDSYLACQASGIFQNLSELYIEQAGGP